MKTVREELIDFIKWWIIYNSDLTDCAFSIENIIDIYLSEQKEVVNKVGCGETETYMQSDYFICGKDYGKPFGILLCDKCKKLEK